MFDIYMYVSFAIMALLFLRQISIYKQPNKINYAPLILSIGIISGVIHFILLAEDDTLIFVLKGSFIPIVVALMFYVVINVLQQTQKAQKEILYEELNKALIEQIVQTKDFLNNLQNEMQEYAQEERQSRENIALKFSEDLQALEKLLENQNKFMQKFEEVEKRHKELTELFINFTEFKLPELDKIIHKHIDILRISEAEHYEKIHTFLSQTIGSKEALQEEIELLSQKLETIKSLSDNIAKDISSKSIKELHLVAQSFQKELQGLNVHTQSLQTSLMQEEGKIDHLKLQTQQINEEMEHIQAMLNTLAEKKELINKINIELVPLYEQIFAIKEEYEQGVVKLSEVTKELQTNEALYHQALEKQIQDAIEQFDIKIEKYLQELKERYQNATDNITDSVKILAKKAQLQKGYSE